MLNGLLQAWFYVLGFLTLIGAGVVLFLLSVGARKGEVSPNERKALRYIAKSMNKPADVFDPPDSELAAGEEAKESERNHPAAQSIEALGAVTTPEGVRDLPTEAKKAFAREALRDLPLQDKWEVAHTVLQTLPADAPGAKKVVKEALQSLPPQDQVDVVQTSPLEVLRQATEAVRKARETPLPREAASEVGRARRREGPSEPREEPPSYVEARQAVRQATLSGVVGSAPPVVRDVTYERILNARSEPQNWLTYYGAYDGKRYSLLARSTKTTSSASLLRLCSSPAARAFTRVRRRTRSRPPRSSWTASCSSRVGMAFSGASTPRRGRRCGNTSMRSRSMSRCAAAT
jgi:hypothetical protein